MLKRRGLDVLLQNPVQYLFFPPDLNKGFEDELYEILKKYSFRIFIRDVIKNKKSFSADDLLRYSTKEWVERYIEFLLQRGIVEGLGGAQYRLKAEAVFSFGDTLEWFVANMFEREFGSPALWGVRLANIEAGGDYDVIASVEGRLVYTEVKSSPPKNIEEAEVAAFIKRVTELKPSCAIFFEDTRLRMKDKLVPMFEGFLGKKGFKAKRLVEETFLIGDKIYITNSKPDIVGNIGFCIKHHLTAEEFW